MTLSRPWVGRALSLLRQSLGPVLTEPSGALRWLVNEEMVDPDGDGGYITNFWAIAAARELRSFDTLERKRIRVIRYRGLNKVLSIDELEGQKGYAIGFEGLIGHLKRILPHSEVIRDTLRAEVAVYPEIALSFAVRSCVYLLEGMLCMFENLPPRTSADLIEEYSHDYELPIFYNP
jgi:hypothetical protein